MFPVQLSPLRKQPERIAYAVVPAVVFVSTQLVVGPGVQVQTSSIAVAFEEQVAPAEHVLPIVAPLHQHKSMYPTVTGKSCSQGPTLSNAQSSDDGPTVCMYFM